MDRADLTRPLAGKVAIVTGSTSGIGLGIARALAPRQARTWSSTALASRRKSSSSARSWRSGCPFSRVAYNGANLMDGDEARRLVEETIADFGRVDILVNNAGIQHVSPIEDFPAEKFDAIIALNLVVRLAHDHGRLRFDEGSRASAGSSTSPRPMAWSPRRSRAPMSPPSMASSA